MNNDRMDNYRQFISSMSKTTVGSAVAAVNRFSGGGPQK